MMLDTASTVLLAILPFFAFFGGWVIGYRNAKKEDFRAWSDGYDVAQRRCEEYYSGATDESA